MKHQFDKQATKFAVVALMMILVCLLTLLSNLSTTQPGVRAAPASDLILYDDTLAGGWEDWSWDSTVNFSAGGIVHNGAAIGLSVDVSAGRKAISPYIYGLNFAKESFADEIDLPSGAGAATIPAATTGKTTG